MTQSSKSDKKNSTPKTSFGITNHNPVDIHVGMQIKKARVLAGLTQTQLADALKVTFQQVQKYERGANRVSASRLWDLTQILDVEISFFFENMKDETKRSSPRLHEGDAQSIDDMEKILQSDPMVQREALELLRSYYLIKTPHLRKKIAKMMKQVGEESLKKSA